MIWFTIVSIVIVFVSAGFGTTAKYHNSIKPIEVYHGNTEMKVKYTILDNDTIKCDTIISLKNRN